MTRNRPRRRPRDAAPRPSDTLGGIKRHSLAASAAVVVTATIGLTGCSSGAETGGGATRETAATVTAPTAPQRVDAVRFAEVVATPGTRIIDVRTPEEFAEGHLAGAVNIDFQGPDFTTRIAALDRADLYAVYCRSGNRSQGAVAAMADAGLASVVELESGILGWQEAGLPTVP